MSLLNIEMSIRLTLLTLVTFSRSSTNSVTYCTRILNAKSESSESALSPPSTTQQPKNGDDDFDFVAFPLGNTTLHSLAGLEKRTN